MRTIYKKYTVIVTCLITLFMVTSCEKEIDVDLKSVEPRVVIEGTIAKDSLAKVSITKTKDFNTNNEFPPVSGAVVTISDNKGNKEILKQDSKGLYVAKTIKGTIGVTYNLHVALEGQEYTSTSTMPELTEINSIIFREIPAIGYAFPVAVLQDPKGITNYYRAILYLNGVRMNIGNEIISDEQRDGFLIERMLPVFDNDREDSREIFRGDTVLVELQSIDKGAYTFFDTLGNMEDGQTNPTTNINGGALGYFSTYTIDKKSVIADW